MSPSNLLPPTRVAFAKRLKSLRIPRGFPTARSFATALEIDENRYTRYERAEVEPDLSLLVKICALLGVTPNDLLDAIPQPTAAPQFAEAAEQPSAHPKTKDNAISSSASRRRALGWQLAEEFASLDTIPAAHALDKVARVSKLFDDITADPFSFLSRMTAERRFEVLDPALTTRLGKIIEELLEATKDDVLGQRSGLRSPNTGLGRPQ